MSLVSEIKMMNPPPAPRRPSRLGVFVVGDSPRLFGASRSERVELVAWRLFGADVMPLLEAALAAQGETPDRKLLSLQHALAELLRSSTETQQERLTRQT